MKEIMELESTDFEDTEEPKAKNNNIFIRIFGAIVLIFIFLFIEMRYIEPSFITTQEYAIINSNIPNSFTGFKIVHFSDIHFGRTTNEKEVSQVVEKINEVKPDLVVFTGDLFDNYITLSDNNREFLTKELSKIKAKLGKYCVMGDTDYLDEESFNTIMTNADFHILNNRNVMLYHEGNIPIFLGGSSSIIKGKQDFVSALQKEKDKDFFQILLCHEPACFKEVKSRSDLVLCGHNLGGLIRIPFTDGIFTKEQVDDYKFGKYTVNSSTLFVSNGIGTENISLRFLNLPTINVYRLYHD